MRLSSCLALVCGAVALQAAGCFIVTNPEPGTPASTGTATATPTTPTTVPTTPATTPAATQHVPHLGGFTPTTVQVHSDCTKTLPLFIGDDPKSSSGTKSSIGSNTTTTFPRKADGTQVIWITDDKDNAITSVQVTRAHRQVAIASDCKTMAAK